MPRDSSLEDTLRSLEEGIQRSLGRIEELKNEQARLEERVRRLEQKRAQAVERLNVILDRMESMG